MATLKISSDLQNVIKKVVLDTYFPVGSLYLTVGNENPNTTIGGTWTKLSGYYLYADTSINNTSYTGKHTQSHKLTTNQIPSHTHVIRRDTYGVEVGIARGGGSNMGNAFSGNWGNTDIYPKSIGAGPTGGGQGHTHNIATKGIYVWQRTA